MKTDELIEALGQLKVQTGSLACLGCGHEHNCGVPVLTYNKWGRARVETLRTWDEQPYFVGGLKAGTDVLFWRPLPQLPEVQ